jgi:hypothetical protein
MNYSIHDFINNFGQPPRRISTWSRMTYLRTPQPDWMKKSNNELLKDMYDNMTWLLKNGVVVWGHVVQVNEALFSDGEHDHPGEVVFSLDDPYLVSPDELRRVANELYALKGTQQAQADKSKASIAHYLAHERIRVFGLQVPTSISRTFECKVSTTCFMRKHLPNGRLSASLLPMIASPVSPRMAIPLPEIYWPIEFAMQWSSGLIW